MLGDHPLDSLVRDPRDLRGEAADYRRFRSVLAGVVDPLILRMLWVARNCDHPLFTTRG